MSFALSVGALCLVAAAPLEAPTMAGSIPVGPYPSLDPPVFEAHLGRGRIAVSGTTASPGHERAINELLDERFAGHRVERRLTPGVVLPADWRDLTLRMLRTLAVLESAEAALGPAGLDLRGVTADHEAYSAAVESLRRALPAAMRLEDDVLVIASDPPLRQLCETAFRELTARPVAFERAGELPRPASHGFLDRLIEFAHDCPGIKIGITGHSDASGDAAWNLELSRRRAQAVADHLARGGIPAARLYVEGVGSARPIGDNATAHGRRLNRRIEFSLR